MELRIRLQPKQSQLWNHWDVQKFTRLGFGGARGGAKSGGGRRCMLLRRLQYPKTTGLILRRTYPELYKSHIVKLFEEYPEIRSWWREQSKELQLPNGSRLFFGSAEHEGDMGSFYSAEFADIMVDEAQEFSQSEIERLSGSNRCTSNPDITPAILCTFMPGLSESGLPPKGLNYLKRVFVDGDRRGEEFKQRWQFVQAFAWDNIEWGKKQLAADGISEEQFYSWTNEERREYFVSRTEFGAVLSALTNQYLREAWLDGKWGIFQGQYFPNFQYERQTVEYNEIKIEPWHKRWISGDWGFDHPFCILWHAEDENKRITTYREFWGREMGETELGRTIGELSKGEKISAFWLSWDAFGKLNPTTRKSITTMIGEGMPNGLPKPVPADSSPGSRISGWRLMHQLIDADMWRISRNCPKLIECLPTLVRDMEKNPEDVLKVDYSSDCLGDDPADAARYGLQNMYSASKEPWEVALGRHLAAIKTPEGQPDYTRRHLEHLRMTEKHEQETKPVFMRKPRGIWRSRRVM